MSLQINLTRDELIETLLETHEANEEINLQQLTNYYNEQLQEATLETFLETFLVSTFALHASELHRQETVNIQLAVTNVSHFASTLVSILNESDLHKYLKADEIVLYSEIPEIIEEVLENGQVNSVSKYSADKIKLVIVVEDSEYHNTPSAIYDNHDCTKIRLVL